MATGVAFIAPVFASFGTSFSNVDVPGHQLLAISVVAQLDAQGAALVGFSVSDGNESKRRGFEPVQAK